MSLGQTRIYPILPEDHRSLCGLVARLIPVLKWRHSGLGMLQAYVYEADAGSNAELRVHIWHPTLQRKGIRDSGLLHDHRFDFYSQVLVGHLNQVEYELEPYAEGPWAISTVVHARAAAGGKHQPNDGLVQLQLGRYIAKTRTVKVGPGRAYEYPKRAFHGTYPETELVVTVVTKMNQEAVSARIMHPFDKPVVHAFSDPLSPDRWQHVLRQAGEQLLNYYRFQDR